MDYNFRDKTIFKIFSYLAMSAVVVFIGWSLLASWRGMGDYEFSLNYFYLILSPAFIIVAIFFAAMAWRKIIKILEPNSRLPLSRTLQIFIYSIPAKYLPGKVWAFAGKSFLAHREGIGNKSLIVSIIYEVFLSTISGFMLSFLLIGIFFSDSFSGFYLITFAAIAIGLVIIHPKVFYKLINLMLIKIKREPINRNQFLSLDDIVKILSLYVLIHTLMGTGFFLLINSVTYLSPSHLIGVIGAYTLAAVFGTVVLFVPAGIGAKEGVLILFLKLYFPLSTAVFLSFLARVWIISTELFLFLLVLIYTKLRTKN